MATESIRELIMQAFAEAVSLMDTGTYGAAPKLVKREYINPLVNTVYPQVSILDTTEQKEAAGVGGERTPFGFVGATLNVTLHVADVARGSVQRSSLGTQWLSDLERVAATLDGTTIGGAMVMIRTTSNELEITEIEAPLMLGAAYVEVRYQHIDGDPTRGN